MLHVNAFVHRLFCFSAPRNCTLWYRGWRKRRLILMMIMILHTSDFRGIIYCMCVLFWLLCSLSLSKLSKIKLNNFTTDSWNNEMVLTKIEAFDSYSQFHMIKWHKSSLAQHCRKIWFSYCKELSLNKTKHPLTLPTTLT